MNVQINLVHVLGKANTNDLQSTVLLFIIIIVK